MSSLVERPRLVITKASRELVKSRECFILERILNEAGITTSAISSSGFGAEEIVYDLLPRGDVRGLVIVNQGRFGQDAMPVDTLATEEVQAFTANAPELPIFIQAEAPPESLGLAALHSGIIAFGTDIEIIRNRLGE